MYDFDLRTPDRAYDVLLTFFNMFGKECIDELIINGDNEFEKFWGCNVAKVNNIISVLLE
jgi:hypothetical protein